MQLDCPGSDTATHTLDAEPGLSPLLLLPEARPVPLGTSLDGLPVELLLAIMLKLPAAAAFGTASVSTGFLTAVHEAQVAGAFVRGARSKALIAQGHSPLAANRFVHVTKRDRLDALSAAKWHTA